MQEKFYLSGMHSGQNPSSGLGIARCIRKAFPRLRLVGVDHWQGSSGLHDAAIDEVLLLPQWAQIGNQRHADQLRALLDQGHYWIPAMDMEIHWLSENIGAHSHLLGPGAGALEATAKPAVRALEGLGFRVPEYISASLPDSDVHTFLRHNSWQCWLKSPYHDAKRISSWGSFVRSRELLSRNWRTQRLFVQRHVFGFEETIAFVAHRGELLAGAHLKKRQLTPEGKTWSGHVTAPDPAFMEGFAEVIRRLEWSGGGEIEYVRDPDGTRWIIECNPRFPAWIYGAALGGRNLPARLVSSVLNQPFAEDPTAYPFFTRVVSEIPADAEVGLPLPPDPFSLSWAAEGKKGKSGPSFSDALPQLAEMTEESCAESDEVGKTTRTALLPLKYLQEVTQIAESFSGETPTRIHLEEWTRGRFEELGRAVLACRNRRPEIRIGYSLKTSPTSEHLGKARSFGFLAECISQYEIRRALAFGFAPGEIILNGPGKFWPLTSSPETGLHMLFCDSIEEFKRVVEIPGIAECLGFRMRIPRLHSRFGNALDDFAGFQQLVAGIRQIRGKAELGFHFHMPSWAIGILRWTEGLKSLLTWCQSIEKLTGVAIRRLDLGGGFFPTDLAALNFEEIQRAVAETLPGVNALYFEPGRSLTQEGEVLVSRILDVRRQPNGDLSEVVVDACIAELPLAQAFTHPVFYSASPLRGQDRVCLPLARGKRRVLGRICMEDDILCSSVQIPENATIGDLIIFGDAGGYERTMSYVFGRG